MRQAIHRLALAAIGSALCWVSAAYDRLSESGEVRRQLILGSIAAELRRSCRPQPPFSPSWNRSEFAGGQTTSISWLLSGLYLLGVGLVAMSRWGRLPTEATNRRLLVLLLMYWSIGAVSDYDNGFKLRQGLLLPRASAVLAAALQRPRTGARSGSWLWGQSRSCAATCSGCSISSRRLLSPTRRDWRPFCSLRQACRRARTRQRSRALRGHRGDPQLASRGAPSPGRLSDLPACARRVGLEERLVRCGSRRRGTRRRREPVGLFARVSCSACS